MSAFLRMAEALRLRGYIVLVTWDGERQTSPYTAVISGAVLDGAFFRRDDDTLEAALTSVLLGVAQRGL